MQRSNLVNLHWSDMDLVNNFLAVFNSKYSRRTLRHERHVPLPVIQAILEHTSTPTTEIYSHLLLDTMQAAVQQTFGG